MNEVPPSYGAGPASGSPPRSLSPCQVALVITGVAFDAFLTVRGMDYRAALGVTLALIAGLIVITGTHIAPLRAAVARMISSGSATVEPTSTLAVPAAITDVRRLG